VVAYLRRLEVSFDDESVQGAYLGVQGACTCRMVAVAETRSSNV